MPTELQREARERSSHSTFAAALSYTDKYENIQCDAEPRQHEENVVQVRVGAAEARGCEVLDGPPRNKNPQQPELERCYAVYCIIQILLCRMDWIPESNS